MICNAIVIILAMWISQRLRQWHIVTFLRWKTDYKYMCKAKYLHFEHRYYCFMTMAPIRPLKMPIYGRWGFVFKVATPTLYPGISFQLPLVSYKLILVECHVRWELCFGQYNVAWGLEHQAEVATWLMCVQGSSVKDSKLMAVRVEESANWPAYRWGKQHMQGEKYKIDPSGRAAFIVRLVIKKGTK